MSENLLSRILFRLHGVLVRPVFLIHHVFICHFQILISYSTLVFLVVRLTKPFYILLVLLVLLIFLIFQIFLRAIRVITFIILLSTRTRPC